MRSIHALTVCAFVAFLSVPAPVLAKVYALVVGIDDYKYIPHLSGAVNDALDITEALSNLPEAEVTTLLNEQATREAFLSVWKDYAARATASDVIVVTFAGHGSNEPAFLPGSEADGKDETLLFAGFSVTGPGAGERIRDDEIGHLIEQSRAKLVFLADSCHSGTVTRSSDQDLSYRFFRKGKLVDDPLPPPPVPKAIKDWAVDSPDARAVFFGAVKDSEKVPELPIDGKIRGALSYAFAEAVRGAGDRNQDGVLSKGELEVFVRRKVRAVTDARQVPQVFPAGLVEEELFWLTEQPTPFEADRDQGPFSTRFDALPPVPIIVTGSEDPALFAASISGAVLVQNLEDAILVADLENAEIRTAQGDRLRAFSAPNSPELRTQFQDSVDKIRAVIALLPHTVDGSLDIWFPLGDDLYFEADPMSILVRGRATEYVTVFNLPSNGLVESLYPRNPEVEKNSRFDDPNELPVTEPLRFDVLVGPPFGADHIVAIETTELVQSVRRAVNRHHNKKNIRALWDDLHFALRGQDFAIAISPFFTREEPLQ